MRATVFLLTVAVVFELAIGRESISFPQGTEPPRESEISTMEKNRLFVENAVLPENEKHAETPTHGEITHYVSNLGLRTLRDLISGESNIIISPLNVYSCLGILDLGAGGKTKEEMSRVLGSRNLNQTMREIVGERHGISYASALFLDHAFIPKRKVVDSALSEFQASVLNMNASNGAEAKNLINRWVSDHTNGTVVDLLKNNLNRDTKMVVVSALLFKGKWEHSFPKNETEPGKFKVDENTLVNVQLMNLLASVPIVRNAYFDAITLPYQDEHGMAMHLILPKEHGVDGLKKLLSGLNANSIKKLRSESVNEKTYIIVPKIKIEARASLTTTLKNQGISSMFNEAEANFTGFADNDHGLFVSQVYHSVHFEMDEEGTMASAATAGILTKSKRFIFSATRPFIFVITDKSDLVLFMGAVVRPEEDSVPNTSRRVWG